MLYLLTYGPQICQQEHARLLPFTASAFRAGFVPCRPRVALASDRRVHDRFWYVG